jgi:uncharacterized integral membrane protein
MLRKIVAALILIPLALVLVLLALANRQAVTISFDPWLTEKPAIVVTQPLFLVLLVVLTVGVIIGGLAAWPRRARWRRRARRAQAEAQALRTETEALRDRLERAERLEAAERLERSERARQPVASIAYHRPPAA